MDTLINIHLICTIIAKANHCLIQVAVLSKNANPVGKKTKVFKKYPAV